MVRWLCLMLWLVYSPNQKQFGAKQSDMVCLELHLSIKWTE